ncbi:MAG: hypothetical protein KC457_35360, partial [Myxococcales bacterium]|nr:hypothetical protein [Myxococcales bacterium]
ASRWVEGMLARRPFGDRAVEVAREVWATMAREDVLEAFDHHPRIGASLESLREKFASTATLSAGEQSGALGADEAVLTALRDGNLRYEQRFGHIFIVCATGKSAAQMLALLEARMDNDPADELAVAAAVPERICGSLATALLDPQQQQEQPGATLAAVERANLFLLPLDAHGRWFRYHHLFRDFLLRRASERGEDWLRARHLRAAQWLAARDLRQEAFEHALAAGELGLITGLFEAWSAELLAGSRTG